MLQRDGACFELSFPSLPFLLFWITVLRKPVWLVSLISGPRCCFAPACLLRTILRDAYRETSHHRKPVIPRYGVSLERSRPGSQTDRRFGTGGERPGGAGPANFQGPRAKGGLTLEFLLYSVCKK